jgi:two-component system NtrC family sensor kinase
MSSGTTLIDRQDLLRISKKLADQAYISLVPTRLARPTERQVEERGLILESAIPVFDIKNDVCGVLYGGILLNRRFDLVDRIRNAIFEAGMYKGKPLGTVTIFLWDTRITTNVLQRDHLRAIGTQISEEVYIQVLEKGERFGNRAFVVNDWYLSAYDPIRDPGGKIIGILYVGLLEEKYLDYKAALTKNFLAISLLALLISIILAVYFSGKIRQPILKLVDATRRLSTGDLTTRLNHVEGAYEIAELSKSFNRMVEYLEKDRKQLQETSRELESAYKQADDKNRAYMETLGFVTHELKSPLASIVFALNSIRERLLGPLTDAQLAVLKSSARSADYLNTTIANFLNLSRIEEGALNLKLAKILLRSRIIDPVIQLLSEMASDNEMKIETTIPSDLEITCDPDLLTSVFQNLVSNAIKYGKKHGTIIISRENESDADLFWFSVYNEGIGFSPQDLQDLFKKFTRFGLKEYSTKTGTGLGLFVTKNIIQNHGGQIRAESEYGLWAKFNFSIPRSVSG